MVFEHIVEVRLAELIASLSLATDLGMGQPMEHGLRVCLLAKSLAEAAGADPPAQRDVYYVSLLRSLGCTSHAHDLARWFDDELEAHRRATGFEFANRAELLRDLVRHAGAGRPPARRLRAIAGALAAGPGEVDAMLQSSCEVAQSLAQPLGLGGGVHRALGQFFERWDGRGPTRVSGDRLELAVRIIQVAADAEVAARQGGAAAAAAAIRARSGGVHDPRIADLFCRDPSRWLDAAAAASPWSAVMAIEAPPCRVLAGEDLERTLQVVADFADLKSPFTHGHSRAVAALASRAASAAALPADEVRTVRLAALVHDVGRAGVPNGIWDKPGALSPVEWERVRLHSYYTDRVLAQIDGLGPVREVASSHHERLDGSGYHRGARAAALSPAARILQAADAYRAMTELRAHRPALAERDAGNQLKADAKAGRLDAKSVDAVLAAAGQGVPRRPTALAGLSPRETEVLRLAVRGLSNREMAKALGVSRHTVGHHLRHIYDKIGVSSRAAAALFVLRHDLH